MRMINIQEAAEDITWIGGSDRRLARFENLFPLEHGVSYNSYVVKDGKTVLFDTADVSVADQYLENLNAALGEKMPDYIVVLHMEPDHCALLSVVHQLYPSAVIVCSMQASNMIRQFFPELGSAGFRIVKEGDTLETGKHTFHFIAAPMVHWPEVLMAFDDATGSLFSADAFGTFGSLDDSIFADDYDFDRRFLDEARRYYANIVGKYGMQVTSVLKKASGLAIQRILPLHGPVWRKDLSIFIGKYQKWSSYTPETDDTLVVYGSLYGHTAEAANSFAYALRAKTGKTVRVFDASKTDVSWLIEEVWRCGKIVLFCPTYNGGIYPPVEHFLSDLQALSVQNRTFALAENGTWAPAAAKLMRARLETLKNVTIVDEVLSFRSALHASDSEKLDAFADAVANA